MVPEARELLETVADVLRVQSQQYGGFAERIYGVDQSNAGYPIIDTIDHSHLQMWDIANGMESQKRQGKRT